MFKLFLILFFLLLPLSDIWAGYYYINLPPYYFQTTKTEGKEYQIPVCLSAKQSTTAKITLKITGGKSQAEDVGIGKNYILGGNVTNITHGTWDYEITTALITFKPGELKKIATIKIVPDKAFTMDRNLKMVLTQPSPGNTIQSHAITIKIIDDTIPKWNGVRNIVSVLTPNLDFDTKNIFDRGILKSAAGDGITDDTVAIQGVIDWIHAHGGGIVYFPGATSTPKALRSNKQNLTIQYRELKSQYTELYGKTLDIKNNTEMIRISNYKIYNRFKHSGLSKKLPPN